MNYVLKYSIHFTEVGRSKIWWNREIVKKAKTTILSLFTNIDITYDHMALVKTAKDKDHVNVCKFIHIFFCVFVQMFSIFKLRCICIIYKIIFVT